MITCILWLGRNRHVIGESSICFEERVEQVFDTTSLDFSAVGKNLLHLRGFLSTIAGFLLQELCIGLDGSMLQNKSYRFGCY